MSAGHPKTMTSKVDMPSVLTSNEATHLEDLPPMSFEQDKLDSEDLQTETTFRVGQQRDLATFESDFRKGTHATNQQLMHDMYRELLQAKSRVQETRKTLACQVPPRFSEHVTLATQEAALRVCLDDTLAKMGLAYAHVFESSRRNPNEQASAFHDLMVQSTLYLIKTSSAVLDRDDLSSPLEQAGGEVFEAHGALYRALSTWESVKGGEDDFEARTAVVRADLQLRDSISSFSKQYDQCIRKQSLEGENLHPPKLDVKKVEAACSSILEQAGAARQSIKINGVEGATLYERADQGATSESESAALQAPEVDHGREP